MATNASNPATQLAELLRSWTVPAGIPPEEQRGDVSARTDGFWRQHVSALGMLIEVQQAILALGEQGYDAFPQLSTIVPDLYQAVFAYSTPWKSAENVQRVAVSESYLLSLTVLGGTLQMDYAPTNFEHLPELEAKLHEARQLILDATSDQLSRGPKTYLLGLINEALAAVLTANEDAGRRARSAAQLVTGAFFAQFGFQPPGQNITGPRERFRRRAVRAAVTVAAATAALFGQGVFEHLGELGVDSVIAQIIGPDETPELPPGESDISVPPSVGG